MDSFTDAELTSRLIGGDEKAFRTIFDKYYQGLVRFAASYIKDVHFAENLVQDAYILLWEKKEIMEIDSNIHAFLVKIVKLKAWNYLEKQRTRIEIEKKIHEDVSRELDLAIHSLNAVDDSVSSINEINRIIEKALLELPEQTRTIFNLSRQEDLSNKEIAGQMNLSVKGIEFHITKALRKLKLELRDYIKILFLLHGI